MSDHQRYEQLAVGHVLGGLDPVDQAEFRSHLLGCRDCRIRVAELRDIASSLEAAEREERAATRVKMETARRDDDAESGADDRASWRVSVSHRFALAAGVATLVLIGLLLWNFHLRDVNRTMLSTTEAREAVLTVLAAGTPVEVDGAPGVSGIAAVDGDVVALDLAGLPHPRPDEWLAIWFLGDDGTPTRYLPYGSGVVDGGVFAVRLTGVDATGLAVTLEQGDRSGRTAPSGRPLADVSLQDG